MKSTLKYIFSFAVLLGTIALFLSTPEPAVIHAQSHTQGPTKPKMPSFVIEGLETRESRRAYFTAPPVIPHEIGSSDRECLNCHKNGIEFMGHFANKTPHPHFKNCQQCHVKGTKPRFIKSEKKQAENNWEGLETPGKGTRQNPFAPPTLPHRVFMRENCATCHSAKFAGQPGLPGPHNERTNCFQCHVTMHQNLDSK